MSIDEIAARYKLKKTETDFAVLYKRLHLPLKMFLYRYKIEDIEDSVQDAFLIMSEKIDLYDTQYGFKTWLFTIAKNLVLNRLLQKKNNPLISIDAVTDDGFTVLDMLDSEMALGIETRSEEQLSVIDNQYINVLHYLLNTTGIERIILVNRWLYNYTYKEIWFKLPELWALGELKGVTKIKNIISAFNKKMKRLRRSGELELPMTSS